MAFQLGEAYVQFQQRGLTSVKTSADKAAKSLFGASSAAKAFGAALGAATIGAAGAKMLQLASAAEETDNRFRSVFRDQADAVDEWAENLADKIGRSQVAIKSGLSSFQSFFVGMGFTAERAADLSKQLQAASIDFASFNNISDQEAMERFISALSGSSEVVDKFGINLKAAAIEQELHAQGIMKSTAQATEQEKAIARLNIIMRSMGQQGALGDAEKTASSYANTMKALNANIAELATTLGSTLLPVLADVTGRFNEALSAGQEFSKSLGGGLGLREDAVEEFAQQQERERGERLDRELEQVWQELNQKRGGGEMVPKPQRMAAERAERQTQAAADLQALMEQGFANLNPQVDDFLGKMAKAVEFDLGKMAKAVEFDEMRAENQERILVMQGKMTEEQARYNELIRDGFTEDQARQLAAQEQVLQGATTGTGRSAQPQFTDAQGINRLVQMAVSGDEQAKLQKDGNQKLDALNESNEQIAGSLKKGIKIDSIPLG